MTRKVTVTTTTTGVPPTYLPNANLSLRAISLWVDDKTGHTITVDQAVIGWVMSHTDAPQPITPGGVPPETQLVVIFDRETKTWSDGRGRVFKEWKQVDAALYQRWAKDHPEHINARGAATAPSGAAGAQPGPAITTPAIGGLASGDHWGVGQAPQAWKPGRS